ncbi:MAG: PIN domain-containing protein [Chthonomonadales bacterium]
MMKTIVLDTGPLGMASNPKSSPENRACKKWLDDHVRSGARVIAPEIADYEVRRELLRANKVQGVARLDTMEAAIEYLAITTAMMRLAAELWATIRQQGQPTASDKALDGDVILAAQALTLGLPETEIVIATVNVGHLVRMVPAQHWSDIL